ncbi:MAG TPA: hypothetical protein PKD10_03220 [Paracoccaceae bacterium]|nr:hypothetical protein [Paracoccaceae bacterium]
MEQMLRALAAQNTLLAARLTAVESLISRGGFAFSPVADPAPYGGGSGGIGGGGTIPGWGGGIGPVADPSPLELSRLSKIQLESRLGDIVFTRKKLDMLEGLYKEALAGVGR